MVAVHYMFVAVVAFVAIELVSTAAVAVVLVLLAARLVLGVACLTLEQ